MAVELHSSRHQAQVAFFGLEVRAKRVKEHHRQQCIKPMSIYHVCHFRLIAFRTIVHSICLHLSSIEEMTIGLHVI